MPPSVLIPQGVRYDFDETDRTPPIWPWVLGGLVLAAIVIGLLLTFHARIAKVLPQKRSSGSSNQSIPVTTETLPAQLQTANETNRMPRWSAAVDVDVLRRLEGAEAVFRAGDLLSARRRYLDLLDHGKLGVATTFVENRLGEIGMLLVLTPRPMPEKADYIVKSGDSLDTLARQFGVTQELLMKANNIGRADRLQPGQHLLILDKPVFSITVDLRSDQLRLFFNGKLLKRYGIGTGRRTEIPPSGAFVIRSRQERVSGNRPGSRTTSPGHRGDALGTRWMSIQATNATGIVKGAYGIHGTWNDDEIGRAVTCGCIRMRNADVEELCLIVPVGTLVRVTE